MITLGEYIEHEHVYERKYDNISHWSECTVCGKKIDEEKHHIEYKGGKNGENVCHAGYPKIYPYCSECGYTGEELPKAPHVGRPYYKVQWLYHDVGCRNCSATSVGNRDGYEVSICYYYLKDSEGNYIYENGKKIKQYIGCLENTESGGIGTCEVCGAIYTEKEIIYTNPEVGGYSKTPVTRTTHQNLHPERKTNGSYCRACKKWMIQQYNQKIIIKNYNTKTVTVTLKSDPSIEIKPETMNYSTWSSHTGSLSYPNENKVITKNEDGSITFTADITCNPNNDATAISLILSGIYYDYNTKTSAGFTTFPISVPKGNGVCNGINQLAPDYNAPIKQSIEVEGNGTPEKISQKAVIKVNYTEEWKSTSNNVWVRLLESDKKTVHTATKDNPQGWQLLTRNEDDSYTGEIDFVGESNGDTTYYVQTKDSCQNLSDPTDGEIVISYVDSKPPTLAKGQQTEFVSPWTNERKITIVANDYGVEEVEIAFNDPEKFEKASKVLEHTWAKTFVVTGDIYENKEYAIYLKDKLGNIRTEYITIGNVDKTFPTVEKVKRTVIDDTKAKVEISANDYCEKRKKEGSGIAGYAITYDKNEPKESDWQSKNTFVIQRGKEYYVWVKDLAGNITSYIPDEIILEKEYKEIDKSKVDKRGIVSEEGKGWNYVDLNWRVENNDIEIPEGYLFRLFQRDEKATDWESVSTKYDKEIRVLNVYPTGNTGATNLVTINSWKDGKITIPKSASLKQWMEQPNEEESKGYGQGKITVDIVSIDDYNKEPDRYLKSNGEYIYDVIVFGTWDCNGKKDLTEISSKATREYINTGRGVLFGHDTLTYHEESEPGQDGCHHYYFNELADLVNMEVQTKIGQIPWVGGKYVKVVKRGYITKVPYNIEDRILNIPLSHTTGERANGKIWLTYTEPFGPSNSTTNIEETKGRNNYFITTWNNCAVTRTGHSNCDATADEQKILSNTIYYLGQATQEHNGHIRTAEDSTGPDKPIVSISANENSSKFEFNVKAEDIGNIYEFQIQGTSEERGIKYSNTVTQEVKTGIKGFSWIITSSEELTEEEKGKLEEIKEVPEEVEYNENLNKWLHIRAIDWAENLGEIAHIQITPGELIPREELHHKLFCVQYGQEIPALNDGTEADATVKLISMDGRFLKYVEVQTPNIGDIIGRRFVSPVIDKNQNIDERYRDAISNSIGRYHVSTEDSGNATDKEAYILSFWDEHTTPNSYVQYALYGTEIALKYNKNYEWPQTDESKALAQEAENYASYKKAWYEPKKIEHTEKAYITEDYKRWLVGPFELDYTPLATQITIGNAKREPVYFCKIIGATLYDQNGNVIGKKDENGKNIENLVDWEFVYTEKGDKRNDELFSYNNYKFPVNEEQFYIKINNLPDTVTGISKIVYDYQKLNASAKYELLEGTYNTVEWVANELNENAEAQDDVLWCAGGSECTHTPHSEKSHLVGAYVYLTSNKITEEGKTSQKLIRLKENNKAYETYSQEITPSNSSAKWKLSVNINGNVWDDGIEDTGNGLREANEKAIKDVKVTMYQVDKNGKQTGIKYEAKTDTGGNYEYKDMKGGLYDIEFAFDGQTYKTTKLLVSGSVEDYKKYYKGNKYINDSVAQETNNERKEFNQRFEEIYADSKARGSTGELNLKYEDNKDGTSSIITNENNNIINQYILNARTSANDIYYPISEKKQINNNSVIEMKDVYNANLGLEERHKTDESLKMDLYKTIFGIKDLKQEYIYSQKNIRNKDSQNKVENYRQKINFADFSWKWSPELSEIWEKAEDCELESYIDYMIVIRNSGEKDYVKISELADYYSDNLAYSNDGYRDIESSSYAYLKWDNVEENKNQIIKKIEKINWNSKSKYGYENSNMASYNKLYTKDLDDLELVKGQYIELHIIFKVNKVTNEAYSGITLNENFENYSEIMGYKTYYIANREVAGLIDKDSRPGNMKPNNPNAEDDENSAPQMMYEIENTDNIPREDTPDGGDTNKNYGNVIEGNVWEDLRKDVSEEFIKKLSNNQIIADGIMQEAEPKIDNVKIELVEVYQNKAGKIIERTINTTRTSESYSISKKQRLNGGYIFTNLASGRYKVKFVYGEYEQIKENVKYNGQDYQVKYTPDIYGGELNDDFSNVEIMLTMDISRSMEGDIFAKEKQRLKEIVNKLTEKMPKVKIGLVTFSTNAKTQIKPTDNKQQILKEIENTSINEKTNIAEALSESEINYTENSKNKIMLLITDGQETVNGEETVIRKLQNIVDEKEIKLITLLTAESKEIFGTEENPVRGSVYNVNSNNTLENAIENIYNEIIENSIVQENRSLAKDLEGTEENPEKGTRWYGLKKYKVMDNKLGEELAIEKINKLEDEEQKKEKMKNFADETYMVALSDTVKFKPNNINKTKLNELNLGLTERPKVDLEVEAEIKNVQVILSDGTLLIDTENGVTKNVMGLGIKDPSATISIYMDEEIMQGATLKVYYRIKIVNKGEIDTLSNYIKGASNDTLTTTALIAYNYTNENMLYREDNQGETLWVEIKENEASKNVGKETESEIKKSSKIYATEKLAQALYPEDSIEAQNGEKTYIETYATMSKLMSPNDDNDTLKYDSVIEIIKRANNAGRRSYTSIPGNYSKTKGIIEPDTAITQSITITKPLGANLNKTKLIVIAAGLGIVVIIGIILFPKKKK